MSNSINSRIKNCYTLSCLKGSASFQKIDGSLLRVLELQRSFRFCFAALEIVEFARPELYH
jgi:hypothetical protein